jgi:hypothetical protein
VSRYCRVVGAGTAAGLGHTSQPTTKRAAAATATAAALTSPCPIYAPQIPVRGIVRGISDPFPDAPAAQHETKILV